MEKLLSFGLSNLGTINALLNTYGTIKKTFGINGQTIMGYLNRRPNYPYNQYNPYNPNHQFNYQNMNPYQNYYQSYKQQPNYYPNNYQNYYNFYKPQPYYNQPFNPYNRPGYR